MFAKLFFKTQTPLPGPFLAWFRGLLVIFIFAGILGHGLMGVGLAQEEADPTLKIGYLSEMPLSWRTNLADPVYNMARCLGAAFSRPIDPDYPLPENNLYGSDSWEELSGTILHAGEDDGPNLFVIQAYEFVKWRQKLNLAPLLLATRNGTWNTRFVIVVPVSSPIRKMGDLEGKTILVHRDGCGDLVDLWLDHVIPLNTGAQRKKFARYQTVTEPQEAILPVFFGESEACVVSEAAYGAVAAQNSDQFLKRLLKLEVSDSEDLPSHVVVCSNSLPLETQSRVIYWAERMTWDFGYQKGGFVAAEAHPEAFANLSGLVSRKVPAANSISEPARAAPPANTIPLKQKRLP